MTMSTVIRQVCLWLLLSAASGMLLVGGLSCQALHRMKSGTAPAPAEGTVYPQRDEKERAAVAKRLGQQIRPLDDPGNPYKDMYESFDYWVYDRIAGRAKGQYSIDVLPQIFMMNSGEDPIPEIPEGWAGAVCSIDQQGWLTPLWFGMASDANPSLMSLGEYATGRRIDEALTDTSPPAIELVRVAAPEKDFPPTIAGAVQDLIEAQSYPAIPRWLAEKPPIAVLFVPNGDFLLYGEPGSDFDSETVPPNRNVLRYSARGELLHRYGDLGANLSDIQWEQLYWRGADELRRRAEADPELRFFSGVGGYNFLLRESREAGRELREVAELYDFDGTALNPDSPYPQERREMGTFHVWKWRLKEIYENQQKFGLRSAAPASDRAD